MVAVARPKPGPTRSYRFPQFHDQALPNGLRVLTAPINKLPIVTVLVVVDAGSSKDPSGKEGVSSLTASALTEGTERLTGVELAEKFEELGTSLESGADWDSAFLKLTVMSDKLRPALELLGEVIRTPAFPAREITRLKEERLAEILQLETEPRGLADEKFSEFLYAADSRYSRPDEGDAGSVRAIARADVEEFYRTNYIASGGTVVIAGDLDPALSRELISSALETWQKGKASNRPLIVRPRSKTRKVHIVHKSDAPQSELRVGHIGLPRRHPDFFSTLVMNAVLGGLFGSRINLNLREVHGYTYGASSYYDWRRDAGPFVVSTAVQSDVTTPALGEIMNEIARIRSDEISETELSLATDYLDGVFPIRYETTSAIAAALANLIIYGLPTDYYDSYRANIRHVSTGSVLSAARTHIHPDELQTVIVGDSDLVGQSLEASGFGDVEVHGA
jgi:zinc protease